MKKITVIGVGKLGLGLALLFEKGGYDVLGVDVNKDYVNQLNEKNYETKEPEYEQLLTNSRNFKATSNLEEGLNHSDLIFIIVQTPNSGGHRFYDHSILSNLLSKINQYKVHNKNLIISCTVMPKYIDEVGEFLIKDVDNSTVALFWLIFRIIYVPVYVLGINYLRTGIWTASLICLILMGLKFI